MLAESESVKPALPQACKRAPASACMPAARGHTQARSFDRHTRPRVARGSVCPLAQILAKLFVKLSDTKDSTKNSSTVLLQAFYTHLHPNPTILGRVCRGCPSARVFRWAGWPAARASKTHFRLFCAADDLQLLRAERPGADARADPRRRRAQDSSRLLGVLPPPSGLHVVSRSNLASESTPSTRVCRGRYLTWIIGESGEFFGISEHTRPTVQKVPAMCTHARA